MRAKVQGHTGMRFQDVQNFGQVFLVVLAYVGMVQVEIDLQE